jgi:cystathionine beta-lyase
MNQAFDFDKAVNRRGTASSKWDKYGNRDVIPMWVADMDFRCAPPIIDALSARIQHGIFGYTDPPAELAPAIVASLGTEYGWQIEADWIVWLPSLVVGLNVVCRAFSDEGEALMTGIPIYPPFLSAPQYAGRTLIRVPHRVSNDTGRWEWDFAALEAAVTARTRLLLLCSPHNPTGRVWTRGELTQLAQFAQRHELIVVSDEIHSGLTMDSDRAHIPFAKLVSSVAARTVTLLSASKTFNLPTLGCAFAIVSDANLRNRMKRVMAGIGHHVGGLGSVATLAAYRNGKPWQQALLDYLRGNRDLVEQEISRMSGVRTWHAEATYLSWIDTRGLPAREPQRFFEDAGVGLYDGTQFGTPGFLRLNFACPRNLLQEALRRMRAALAGPS